MEKILLAVGFRELEEYLQKQLKNEFLFVGTTVYREGIIRAVGQKNPDIVVIRETLGGKENILKIVYELRTKYPKLRIVFIAGKREPGDALLATLVSYGVYDILTGVKIKAQEVVRLIRKKNEYKDVQHLQPVPILDEERNEVLFKAPSPIVQEKEVIKEIYIEKPVPAETVPKEEKQPLRVTEEEIRPVPVETVTEPISASSELPVIEQEVIQKKTSKKKETEEKLKEQVEPIETSEEETKEKSRLFENAKMVTAKQKVITFIAGKGGVGTTSIGLNTAVSLAKKGLKTVYVEFNEKTPAVSYWYEVGYINEGIDSALLALEQNTDFNQIEKSIVKSKDLKTLKTLMKKNYKKFPDTLDFMFFSKRYLTKETVEGAEYHVNLNYVKDLILHLMLQLNYDIIILDVPSDVFHPATTNALIYSNQVFLTVTQDVSSIGYAIYNLNEIDKAGINLDNKLHFLINKFEKSKLSVKEIEEWVQCKNTLTVPIQNREFINANFIGLPVVLYTKNSELLSAFENIAKVIIS